MAIKTVAIVGAGAIGSMISDNLELAYGKDFYLFCKNDFLAAPLKADGLTVNGRSFKPVVIQSKADMPEKLDLAIITVKNFHLASTIEDLKTVIDGRTVILPLLNVVYAFDTLTREFPDNHVLCGIMVKTDAHPVGPGLTAYSTAGEIQVGEGRPEDAELAKEVSAFVNVNNLESNYYPNIRHMQWRKFMLNVGVNQITALTRAEFGMIPKVEEIPDAMRLVMHEVLEVANAEGIDLHESDIEELIEFTHKYPEDKQTSMLTDVLEQRPTEIDFFAGDVIRYGKKHGIATPYNEILYYVIRGLQKVYLAKR